MPSLIDNPIVKELLAKRLQRYESYHGRTTPEIEWRAWNKDHTCYMPYPTKRDAVAYLLCDLVP